MSNETKLTPRELKVKEIQEHPELHKHDYDSLIDCCIVDGAIDLQLIDLHPAVGYNGGQKCDVIGGPCSCGAWH